MTLPDAGVDSPGWIRLPWDSDHFGISIGRLLSPAASEVALTRALRSADAAGIRCLYLLSDPDEAQVTIAQRAGFKKVDVRVELALDLASKPLPLESAPEVREAGGSDLVPLKALASRSHRNTRFYTDRSFPPDRADALYAAWIEQSFQDPAQVVYVAGLAAETDGYIAFGVSEEGHGLIGLLAVAESQRGQGLGEKLVRAAFTWFTDRGVNQIQVTTQGNNQPAHRLYRRLGFKASSTAIWLHRWLE